MNIKLKEDILKALEDSILNAKLIIDLRCLDIDITDLRCFDIDSDDRLLDLYMKEVELSERLINEIKKL